MATTPYNSLMTIMPSLRTPSPSLHQPSPPTFDVSAVNWPSLPTPQQPVQLQRPQPVNGLKPSWIKSRKGKKAKAIVGSSTPSATSTSESSGIDALSSTSGFTDHQERAAALLEPYQNYLTKWDQVLELLWEHESSHLLQPPSLRFQDLPWPVTNSLGDIVIFPISQSIRWDIRRFLVMDHLPNMHYQVQFNLAIWGVLDFDLRLVPLIVPTDRWMASRLAHDIQAMLYVIPIIDAPGSRPYLRYRQDSVFRLQRYARLARHSADAPQEHELVLPFIFAEKFLRPPRHGISTDSDSNTDPEL